METVSSVLSLSTTMISSAHERDSRAAWMLAASLKVITVAVTDTATILIVCGYCGLIDVAATAAAPLPPESGTVCTAP